MKTGRRFLLDWRISRTRFDRETSLTVLYTPWPTSLLLAARESLGLRGRMGRACAHPLYTSWIWAEGECARRWWWYGGKNWLLKLPPSDHSSFVQRFLFIFYHFLFYCFIVWYFYQGDIVLLGKREGTKNFNSLPDLP